MVVPDSRAWLLWGVDLRALGFEPAPAPASAAAMVLPPHVPRELVEAVRGAWAELPPPRRVVELDAPAQGGVPAAELLGESPEREQAADAEEHGGEEHGGEDGHDHGDMMEITGEPSRDGLVMEDIELVHGPLAPGLPGGLRLDVELDGDVVAACRVSATLRRAGHGPPDPTAPASWRVASDASAEQGGSLTYEAAAAVEWERALSHLAWLYEFALLLGWQELAERSYAAAAPLARARGGMREEVAAALRTMRPLAQRLGESLTDNRRLRMRTRGRAEVAPDQARERGIVGPNARASGVPVDARADDPLYRSLGFEPRVGEAGDAEARVLQRAGETIDAVALGIAALERAGEPAAAGEREVIVESPRGPLRASPPLAAGAAAARGVAGERAKGLEWASALVAVASFDLSPWDVAAGVPG